MIHVNPVPHYIYHTSRHHVDSRPMTPTEGIIMIAIVVGFIIFFLWLDKKLVLYDLLRSNVG